MTVGSGVGTGVGLADVALTVGSGVALVLGVTGAALTVGSGVGLALGVTGAALTVGSGVGTGVGLTVAANLRPAATDVTAKAAAEVATLTEAKETASAFKREEAAAW